MGDNETGLFTLAAAAISFKLLFDFGFGVGVGVDCTPLRCGGIFDFSIGFILVFYDLWDLYIRDNKNFDEYDYNVYYNKSDISNNIVSGSLHPLIFDSQTDC